MWCGLILALGFFNVDAANKGHLGTLGPQMIRSFSTVFSTSRNFLPIQIGASESKGYFEKILNTPRLIITHVNAWTFSSEKNQPADFFQIGALRYNLRHRHPLAESAFFTVIASNPILKTFSKERRAYIQKANHLTGIQKAVLSMAPSLAEGMESFRLFAGYHPNMATGDYSQLIKDCRRDGLKAPVLPDLKNMAGFLQYCACDTTGLFETEQKLDLSKKMIVDVCGSEFFFPHNKALKQSFDASLFFFDALKKGTMSHTPFFSHR